MMHTTETRVFELREADLTGDRTMRGVAVPYGVDAPIAGQYLEQFTPGCFAKSIKEAARGLPLYAIHAHDRWPIGRSISWEDTPEALIGQWEFASSTEADEARGMVRDGLATGLSVGFVPIRSDWDPGSETAPPRVKRREGRLFETSITPIPTFAAAQILHVRTAGVQPSTPHVDQWRRWFTAHQERSS
jgi:HK97 family phage prohead protease